MSSYRNENVDFEIVRRAHVLRAAIAIKYIQNKLYAHIESDNMPYIKINEEKTRELLTILGKDVNDGPEMTAGFISADLDIAQAVADILEMDVLIGIQNGNVLGAGYIFAAPKSKSEEDKKNSAMTYGYHTVDTMNYDEMKSVDALFNRFVENNKGNSVIILLRENHYVPLGLGSNGKVYDCNYDYYKLPEVKEVQITLDGNNECDKLNLFCQNLNFNLKQQQNDEKNFTSDRSDAVEIVDLLIKKGFLGKKLKQETIKCIGSYFRNKNKNSICATNQNKQSLYIKMKNAEKKCGTTMTRSTDRTKNLKRNEIEQ